MLLDTAQDLSDFVEELKSETERGLPLIATALIDEILFETLKSHFRKIKSATNLLDGGNAPLGSFSARLNCARALGLISNFEHSEIDILRRIRNEFAHNKHGYSFSKDKVTDLCSNLKSPFPDGVEGFDDEPRQRFSNATVYLVLRLYYRPRWVEKMLEAKERGWNDLSIGCTLKSAQSTAKARSCVRTRSHETKIPRYTFLLS